ncbi:hypothetical protein A3Q56_04849 [Intoshia linei]|uniref:Wbp11/ELF5/Saf1 N-terminal domain-containing protein n=1 Tax=Intoshia linei TaxID=1819745 RepID=A0A177AZI0_9BILA|nr:hypothetical protein A3Q56_04849 [Intoshia linei]
MGKKKSVTKAGRFITPTDRERKKLRVKEKAKNRKQRYLKRVSVIMEREPHEIIEDMVKLDDNEYCIDGTNSLNPRVITEKRNRLKLMFDKICKYYNQEKPEKVSELRRILTEYESGRLEKIIRYEQYKSYKNIDVDTIPLPSSCEADFNKFPFKVNHLLTKSILQKPKLLRSLNIPKEIIASPPPSPPPAIFIYGDEPPKFDKNEKKVRFDDVNIVNYSNDPVMIQPETIEYSSNHRNSKFSKLPPMPTAPNVPEYMSQPPPPLFQNQGYFGMNVPSDRHHHDPAHKKSDVFINSKQTFESKPILRNLMNQSTIFTPSQLKVKRETKDVFGRIKRPEHSADSGLIPRSKPVVQSKSNASKLKDVAYDQFMKDIGSLL